MKDYCKKSGETLTRIIAFCFFLFCCSGILYAQDINVTGKVTDSKGNPVSGVSVIVKGTSTGANTNAEGRYTIRVSGNNAVLEFSSVGYVQKEETVGTKKRWMLFFLRPLQILMM